MGHFASFLITHACPGAVLLSAGIAGKVIRRWIAHRTATRHEAESTRRMALAVQDTTAAQRAAVVRACAELEAASRNAHGPQHPRHHQ